MHQGACRVINRVCVGHPSPWSGAHVDAIPHEQGGGGACLPVVKGMWGSHVHPAWGGGQFPSQGLGAPHKVPLSHMLGIGGEGVPIRQGAYGVLYRAGPCGVSPVQQTLLGPSFPRHGQGGVSPSLHPECLGCPMASLPGDTPHCWPRSAVPHSHQWAVTPLLQLPKCHLGGGGATYFN